MRVLVTGSTGFVGSYVVPELVGAGYQVIGLTRSDAGAAALERVGATVLRGDVNDLDAIAAAAAQVEGVIHTAFNHDPTDQKASCEADRRVVAALGGALIGSPRPLVVTSGTGLVVSPTGGTVVETDPHPGSEVTPRAASEEAADTLAEQGVNVSIVRLPQVHDTRRHGRLRWHIEVARRQGRVADIGDRANRVPGAHARDVAYLYRLVLERAEAGSRYHAVAEEGVPLREIAEVIGARMGLPVDSITPDEAPAYFGPLARLAGLDLPASGVRTQEVLGWSPDGPTLLDDLRNADDEAITGS